MKILFTIDDQAMADEVAKILGGNTGIKELGLKLLRNLITKGAIEVEFPPTSEE